MDPYSLVMTDSLLPLRGSLHHVELRVASSDASDSSWQWVLNELGYHRHQSWAGGVSWKIGDTYIVLETVAGVVAHDRRQAGLSHVAFHAHDESDVDQLWDKAPSHGWRHLYADRHPWAGGESNADSAGHYAAFLENDDRFKIEIVASGRSR